MLPGKEKVVDELRRLAKSADQIYLATDLDREGEAIAWHLMEAIGGDPSRYRRVVFNEITRNAIESAFKSPGSVDINRVNAQQARRFLDRVVGFMVSPLLWAKIARGLSAGRVQSVVKGCLDRGILGFWFLSCPTAFRIAPPLTIQPEEVDLACGAIRQLLDGLFL